MCVSILISFRVSLFGCFLHSSVFECHEQKKEKDKADVEKEFLFFFKRSAPNNGGGRV